MKPRKWIRILRLPNLTLHQCTTEPKTYSVRSKSDGRWNYRVFQAPTDAEAVRMAPRLAQDRPAETQPRQWRLDETFAAALAASRRGATARTDWDGAVRQFVLWLVEYHPTVAYWQHLTRPLLREYQQSLAVATPGVGRYPAHVALSPNGIRIRLQPLIQTDAHMAREHATPRVADHLSISRELSRPVAAVYLVDALSLLDYLRTAAPECEAPAALQALAGLRVQEVTRLPWSKIDQANGLVEVSGAVKTAWSTRVIPVPARALDALRRAPQGIGNALLVDAPHWRAYSRPLTAHIRAWNSAVTWSAKDLRNVVPTWAIAQSHMSPLVEQYLGHAPQGVTARHYVPRLVTPTEGERQELDRQMDLFRTALVTPLDQAIAAEAQKAKRPSVAAGAQ